MDRRDYMATFGSILPKGSKINSAQTEILVPTKILFSYKNDLELMEIRKKKLRSLLN